MTPYERGFYETLEKYAGGSDAVTPYELGYNAGIDKYAVNWGSLGEGLMNGLRRAGKFFSRRGKDLSKADAEVVIPEIMDAVEHTGAGARQLPGSATRMLPEGSAWREMAEQPQFTWYRDEPANIVPYEWGGMPIANEARGAVPRQPFQLPVGEIPTSQPFQLPVGGASTRFSPAPPRVPGGPVFEFNPAIDNVVPKNTGPAFEFNPRVNTATPEVNASWGTPNTGRPMPEYNPVMNNGAAAEIPPGIRNTEPAMGSVNSFEHAGTPNTGLGGDTTVANWDLAGNPGEVTYGITAPEEAVADWAHNPEAGVMGNLKSWLDYHYPNWKLPAGITAGTVGGIGLGSLLGGSSAPPPTYPYRGYQPSPYLLGGAGGMPGSPVTLNMIGAPGGGGNPGVHLTGLPDTLYSGPYAPYYGQ